MDGDAFIPEDWFSDEAGQRRQQAGIPQERSFQTKPELGWRMIQRVWERDLPFEAVRFDKLYGRNPWLRDQVSNAGLEYYTDTPVNTNVYLKPPVIGVPRNTRGPKAKKERVLSPKAVRVDRLRRDSDTFWQAISLRPSERGYLKADFARRRVWTVRDDHTVVEEWLLIRRDGKKHTYTFSNAPAETPLLTMAHRKS